MAHEHAIELIDLELENLDSDAEYYREELQKYKDTLQVDSQSNTARKKISSLTRSLAEHKRVTRELRDSKEVLEKLDRGEFSNTYHPRYAVQGYVSFDRDKVIR